MMTSSSPFLQRAQALADRHRAEQRELSRMHKLAAATAPESGFWSFLYEEDPVQEDYRKALRRLARTEASLRVAIDNLVGIYCDELRRSPWYIAAQESRASDIDRAHARFGAERRLIGLAREIRRSIAALRAEIASVSRNALDVLVGLDGELSIFERWRQLRYKTTRLARLVESSDMPSLDPYVPNNVYLTETEDRYGEMQDFINALWEETGRALDSPFAISLTMRSLSEGLGQWLPLADAFVTDVDAATAEEAANDLEETILSAAHDRLPANLRPWHVLLTQT